jgi:hypothetical protein
VSNGERDEPARRLALMEELGLINVELARLGVPARVTVLVADLYPTEQLPDLIAAARQHFLVVLYQLGGTA